MNAPRQVRLAYVFVMGFAGMFLGLLAMFTYVKSSVRASTEETRRSTCLVISAQKDVYEETQPSTPAGAKAAKAWVDLSNTLGCK